MPFLILAALVVIVLMLYIALGGKEGAPGAGLNKIFDFIAPKPAADETVQDADAPEAEASAPEAPATEGAATAASETAEETTAANEGQAEAKAGDAPNGASFGSMEELTDFYRKEAERLTGIKH
jgi:hypothetical protein